MSKDFGQLLSPDVINAAVTEYELNVDAVAREFKERTGLQDADAAFVVFASALQVLRIVLSQWLRPEKQKAGQKNEFEKKLHKTQDKVLKHFGKDIEAQNHDMHASLHHIVTNRGVPYDATRFKYEKLDIFKGANHRFSTLGHDPLLGLVFGTSNILTNTITTIKKNRIVGIPTINTNFVEYDLSGKNPEIVRSEMPIKTTADMLKTVNGRLDGDKKAVVAALIKQIIHIGTDVYTTAGIQLPGVGLVLNNKTVERLTAHVGMAELAEFGEGVAMATFINWIVASLHGCTLLFQDDGTDYCTELYQARTRKIISLSNVIATSSNVIAAAVKPNVVHVDLGGLAVTLYRLISDTAFVTKLKYEYINSEVSKIYDARGEGIVDPGWLEEAACLEKLGLG